MICFLCGGEIKCEPTFYDDVNGNPYHEHCFKKVETASPASQNYSDLLAAYEDYINLLEIKARGYFWELAVQGNIDRRIAEAKGKLMAAKSIYKLSS